MKRFLAVAAALSFVACASGRTAVADRDVVSYSVYPPTTVVVEKVAKATEPGGMIEIGDVSKSDLAPVQAKFDERVTAGDKEVWFRIDSFGGSIFAGNDFIQHIEDAKRAKGLKVVCVVDTKAYSMGFVFLQTFCDQRLMTKMATLLAHSGSTQVSGTVEQILSEVGFMLALNESMAATIAERLGMPVEDYKARIAGKDWTMAHAEAMAVNAIDGTISTSKLPPVYVLEKSKPDLRSLLGF